MSAVTLARAGLVGLLVLARSGLLVGAQPTAPRPNILWITCEDISPTLGCYGDRYARTPVLDRLASEGVRYSNAFAVAGVCAPNRSCLITGMYPSSLGSQDMRTTTRLPQLVQCFPRYLRPAGYYCTNNVKTDYNFDVPVGVWDESSKKAHWRNRRPGQPFFSVFNFTTTHEGQIRQPDDAFRKATARLLGPERHDPAKVLLPPFHPDTPEVRQDWARYYDLITAMDYQVGDILRQLKDDGLANETIVFFFSDHGAGMPGYKRWVWDTGLHVPLVIRFPQKFQSWAPGQPGSECDRLVSFVDFAPTVLSLAGVPIGSHLQGEPFLGPRETKPRQYIYAIRDRMDERYDIVRVVRDKRYQYLRNYMPQLSWSQPIDYCEQMPTMRIWRRLAEAGKLNAVQARFFLPAKPIEELYDMNTDRYQLHNLAGEPEYGEVLQRLRHESVAWMQRTGDLGLLPDYELSSRAEGRTPFEIPRDPQLNPLGKLIAAANLANRRDPKAIGELLGLLESEDAAVRYWGAVGLVALGREAEPAREALRKATADSAPNVRIAAAEALCQIDQVGAGLPILVECLSHRSALVRLQAINALDRLGPNARPALEAMRRAVLPNAGHAGQYLQRMVEHVPAKFEAERPR